MKSKIKFWWQLLECLLLLKGQSQLNLAKHNREVLMDKLSFWVLKDLLRFPYYFYSWIMLEFTSHDSQFKLLYIFLNWTFAQPLCSSCVWHKLFSLSSQLADTHEQRVWTAGGWGCSTQILSHVSRVYMILGYPLLLISHICNSRKINCLKPELNLGYD